jgi:hypothetical protein
MKKTLTVMLLAGFLMACGSKTTTETKAPEATAAPADTVATAKGDSAKTSYACPMKCEKDKKYEQAGKCPVCKMDLVAAK